MPIIQGFERAEDQLQFPSNFVIKSFDIDQQFSTYPITKLSSSRNFWKIFQKLDFSPYFKTL